MKERRKSLSFTFIKQKALKSADFKAFGADTQIRTGDLILTKDALYLLSYISKIHAPYRRGMSGDREGT